MSAGRLPGEDVRMRKFNIGDRVLCIKYEITQEVIVCPKGFEIRKAVDKRYFGKEAVILNTIKNVKEKQGFENYEDRAEYELLFINNGEKAAWFTDDDLLPLVDFSISG